jgi:hypothetical protein
MKNIKIKIKQIADVAGTLYVLSDKGEVYFLSGLTMTYLPSKWQKVPLSPEDSQA